MEYKYEDVESVVATRDFEIFRHDGEGELVGVVTIPKGATGVVQSMGCNSTDNFKNHYDILFVSENNEIEVSIFEDAMELYLNVV